MKKTGWPPGLLQDDCSKLSRWFASRIDARETVRRVFRQEKGQDMTQDEIIELAHQAYENCDHIPNLKIPKEFVERFAKLVAAKEREACAEICENFADVDSYPDGIIQDYHAHLIRLRGKA